MKKTIILRQLGIHSYQPIFNRMQQFTKKRKINTPDEIWLLEHFPVFTQGRSGKKEHLLRKGNIPLIQSDRGGQITYHAPGQQIMYILLDLRRHKITVKKLIKTLEDTVINTLSEFSLYSFSKRKLPGVYVKEKKICSLGLRIHKGYSLHGLALNVNMDLSPFQFINPCGYKEMKMTQVNDFVPGCQIKDISPLLVKHFCNLTNLQSIE